LWLRRTFAWSGSRQAWQELIGGLALPVALVGLIWYRGVLSALQQVILGGLLLVAATVLLRRGWLKLFGPVLFYDMVRSARRGRYVLLRCAYAAVLLLLLCSVLLTTYLSPVATRRDLSHQAEVYFEVLTLTQLAAVLLLTPVFVAGAIAEEKDRRTMEYLLATDLRNREIVLSKLVARLAGLTLLVLTGLPLVSLLQFLGGVDPNLVLAAFAATALTMLGLGGVSILLSTYLRKPRDAIALTYMAVAAYYLLSFLGRSLLDSRAPFLHRPVWFGEAPPTVADVLHAWNSGNVLVMIGQVRMAGGVGTLATTLPRLLGQYAVFQGLVAGVCVGWSVLRLRAVALKQAEGLAPARRFAWRWPRPLVGTRPMLWKEIFVEGGTRLGWLGRAVLAVLVVSSFLPAAEILYFFFLAPDAGYTAYGPAWTPWDAAPTIWQVLAERMNGWVRTAGTLVGCLTLLWVAVRASTCVSRERDRQTFDALLVTPLESNEILFSKCLGSVLAVRWLWLWLGSIWALGILTGGLHALALALVLVAWLVYAAALSVLGTWFSVVSRTSLRATSWTLFSAGALGVGHWLVWACCGPLLLFGGGHSGGGGEVLLKLQAGFTPPVALAVLQFSAYEPLGYRHGPGLGELMGFCIIGLFVWGLFTALLWNGLQVRFRALTNRLAGNESGIRRQVELPRADREPRPARPSKPQPLRGAVLIEELWESKPKPPRDGDGLPNPPTS
jgi:ABC-type transport system involved in multi-copper enzyme maturation permease subunit